MPTMSLLITKAIENTDKFPPQSLSVVLNSLADLGVKNETLFQKSKQYLMKLNLNAIDSA